jgi:hypothetical protein
MPMHTKTTLILDGNTYRLVEQSPSNEAHGNVVVLGDEIDFFNGSGCGLSLPKGVGRYHWALQGTSTLTLTTIDDVCGRIEELGGSTWSRGGP